MWSQRRMQPVAAVSLFYGFHVARSFILLCPDKHCVGRAFTATCFNILFFCWSCPPAGNTSCSANSQSKKLGNILLPLLWDNGLYSFSLLCCVVPAQHYLYCTVCLTRPMVLCVWLGSFFLFLWSAVRTVWSREGAVFVFESGGGCTRTGSLTVSCHAWDCVRGDYLTVEGIGAVCVCFFLFFFFFF